MSDKQIIVCHEKHGEQYYDASTPELWAKAALAILTDRFNQGYWYYDPRQDTNEFSLKLRKERDDLLAMTDEQIDAIPSDEARVELRKKRKQAQRRAQADREAEQEYDVIKQIVESQDDGFVTIGRGRWEHEVPKAWLVLEDRSDHEYERVELEQLQ